MTLAMARGAMAREKMAEYFMVSIELGGINVVVVG